MAAANIANMRTRLFTRGLLGYALQKAVLGWIRKNFLHLKATEPDIAASCLIGGISFVEAKICLVRTHLGRNPGKDILEL
jgi:hypothetical protein